MGTNEESVSATTTIDASVETVFAVLADPSRHAGIDGTGWVASAVDDAVLTSAGQLFTMAMFHPDHLDGGYETVNQVVVLEAERAISWRTGYIDEDGRLAFGGWWWRCDVVPVGERRTRVTLTYDWSDVAPGPRAYLHFPPFAEGHLDRSLGHLAQLVG